MPENRSRTDHQVEDHETQTIRLPRRRHLSPWASRRVLLASVVGLLLLIPLWLDPATLGELRSVTPPSNMRPSGGRASRRGRRRPRRRHPRGFPSFVMDSPDT